jgi:hypothetical protein
VKISVEDWATVSRLLDEILDLPAPAREMWIDGMPEEMGRFRLTLRELLALYASGEAGDFLATSLSAQRVKIGKPQDAQTAKEPHRVVDQLSG